jgi:hypothetical protein
MSAPAAAAGHPQVGSLHKNGDRMFGIAGPYSLDLAARGTPKLSSLHRQAVTPLISGVRIGDQLRVDWDGSKHWWASSDAGVIGRLSWFKSMRDHVANLPANARNPYDFDNGVLHVQTVTIDDDGDVVDCGGYVVPDGHDPAQWNVRSEPQPPRQHKPPVPAAEQTRSVAPAEAQAGKSFLRRFLGR